MHLESQLLLRKNGTYIVNVKVVKGIPQFWTGTIYFSATLLWRNKLWLDLFQKQIFPTLSCLLPYFVTCDSVTYPSLTNSSTKSLLYPFFPHELPDCPLCTSSIQQLAPTRLPPLYLMDTPQGFTSCPALCPAPIYAACTEEPQLSKLHKLPHVVPTGFSHMHGRTPIVPMVPS